MNNLLTELNAKYADRWPGYGDDIFDQKRGKLSYDIYASIKNEIDASVLRPEMKRMLTGYFQECYWIRCMAGWLCKGDR